ncbi:hypothetical protein N9Y48_04685 [Zobellia sp.]|nr:hypothetical protein [Zobellia sp.]
MKTASNLLRLFIPIFALAITLGSCNKDTDLVIDYVYADTSDAPMTDNFATNHSYDTPNTTIMLLDALSNDSNTYFNKVTIMKTSEPMNNAVAINKDRP